MTVTTRLATLEDVPVLAELVRVNREFLAPWEPARDESYFTDDGQHLVISDALNRHKLGMTLPHVILDSGRVIGRINLNTIELGPFQSCTLGYWVGAEHNGRGVATAAVSAMIRVVFEEMGLHRIQAGTLLHNDRSQRVLERNGFARYGMAPKYLSIAGAWQDHYLYQLIAPAAS